MPEQKIVEADHPLAQLFQGTVAMMTMVAPIMLLPIRTFVLMTNQFRQAMLGGMSAASDPARLGNEQSASWRQARSAPAPRGSESRGPAPAASSVPISAA